MTKPASALALIFTAALTFSVLGGQAQAEGLQQPSASSVSSVIVQKGETVYSIAKRVSLSVDQLRALNNLTTDTLEIGQVLLVRAPVYIAQKGDTVYSVARQYGVTPAALLAANTLPPSAKLEIGQALRLPSPAAIVPQPAASVVADAPLPVTPAPVATAPAPTVAPAPQTASAPSTVENTEWYVRAASLMGTPYVLGGTTRKGTDCSGLVIQVFAPMGITLPRRSADQARVGDPVGDSDLRPGDLVFFDTLGKGRVSHVGIYIGNDQFINANTYYGKVVVDRLRGDDYWAKRYLGARRVMSDMLAQR